MGSGAAQLGHNPWREEENVDDEVREAGLSVECQTQYSISDRVSSYSIYLSNKNNNIACCRDEK